MKKNLYHMKKKHLYIRLSLSLVFISAMTISIWSKTSERTNPTHLEVKDINPIMADLRQHSKNLVFFKAEWSGPSKLMERSVLPDIKRNHPEMGFIYCDVDDSFGKLVSSYYNIRDVPTILLITRYGIVKHTIYGAVRKYIIEEKIAEMPNY